MFYLIKIPSWFNRLYKGRVWSMPDENKIIYLSFDDGPHPVITPFVLQELKKYNARATFFCTGRNVIAHHDIYQQIIEDGHRVGNHSFNHLNGWKTKDNVYLDDIAKAKKYIDSNLFRPPYGRMSTFQLRQLSMPRFNLKTIMWNVLSGDFDEHISPEKCLQNVLSACKAGSIVVFHDSEKANDRMRYALPRVLKYFTEKGYAFEGIRL